MKKHNKYLFVPSKENKSVNSDTSDGYLTQEDDRIKLPHSNFTLLGIVEECVNSAYDESFSKEIVKYVPNAGDGYGGYWNYHLEAWGAQFETAVESMKTLIEKLDLKPTDYILRDEN